MMPEIEVSDSLYSKIEEVSDSNELEDTMWEMVYLLQRGNDPT
ncbi:phosphohydrolase [Natronoarchaeum sp. GCM10025703]